MKRCVATEHGGCGKVKSLDAFSISKFTVDGKAEYRPRCKSCMCKWKKLSAAQRDAMRIPLEDWKPRKVQKGEKKCFPPERGGCGKILPLSEFHGHNGYHKPRCRHCAKKWKAMTHEERRPFIPDDKFEASKRQQDAVMEKAPAVIEYTPELHRFFHIPATDCQRSYHQVGLQI